MIFCGNTGARGSIGREEEGSLGHKCSRDYGYWMMIRGGAGDKEEEEA